jgi:two-component system cell cycle response regulator
MSKVLGKNYEVIEAEHGEDAWTLLINESDIQTVFTDLSMPYLDGFGLLDRMRSSDDPRLQDMPVIIITGKDDDEATKQKALDKGASDFITKPFDSVQLQARAKAHVRFKETSRKLTETSDRLERQSAIDELTGLGGRNYFCKASDEHLAYTKRHGGHFTLLRLDIDEFNQLFIQSGKEQAYFVLRQVGHTLAKIVRKEDTVARIGLAKFALLLRDTPIDGAKELTIRILRDISALTFKVGKNEMRVTASIGLLEPVVLEDTTIEGLISEAEKYLDRATKAGGNRMALKSLRQHPVEQKINVQTALSLLDFGHADTIKPHINELVKQLLPLLEFIAENLEGKAGQSFKAIKDKLTS